MVLNPKKKQLDKIAPELRTTASECSLPLLLAINSAPLPLLPVIVPRSRRCQSPAHV